MRRHDRNRAAGRMPRGPFETSRLIWVVNVMDFEKAGQNRCFGSYRRPRQQPETRADAAYMAVSCGLFKAFVRRMVNEIVDQADSKLT
jgi:hypothetical protein